MAADQIFKTVQSLIGSESSTLDLTIGQHGTIAPGQEIPKSDAQTAPTLSLNSPTPAESYIIIALDIDAPFPSFGALGPILHWIQPGLKLEPLSSSDQKTTLKASATTPFIANYIGPAPPPFSAAHRYIFLLYEQPAGFDGGKYAPAGGAELGNWQRMRYDLTAFEKEANLGPVVAGNYFRSR